MITIWRLVHSRPYLTGQGQKLICPLINSWLANIFSQILLSPADKALFSEQKPEGWLDDEPEYIPDPNGVKPDDWDDDEDGEWEAPQIGKHVYHAHLISHCLDC